MSPSSALLGLVFSAVLLSGHTSAAPNPLNALSTLPFSTHINHLGTGFSTIIEADQARAKQLKGHGSEMSGNNTTGKRSSSVSATNVVTTYNIQVGIGSPATEYTLLIDTGSSNTWVGADRAYVKTSTSKNTGHAVAVSYGSGSFSGTEYNDTVSLSSVLTVTGQGLGVANRTSGFSGVDGILGIGPVDLTEQTVSGISRTSKVPTITDTLKTQGKITTEVIGIYYAPINNQSATNGKLTFGGVDTTMTTSTIKYANITKTSPANQYWGIDQTILYGSTSILTSTAGIVDTGTTLILLATSAFNAYKSATGAVSDPNTGLLKITSAQYSALKSLNFKVGSTTYPLTPNGQIWPRSLNTAIGGSSSSIYLIVQDLGSPAGEGLDFINGFTFLERFYSVFDTTNSRVGLATTAQTNSTIN